MSARKVQSPLRTSVSAEAPTYGQESIGPKSDEGGSHAFARLWRSLRTNTQLFLITAFIVSGSMVALGYLVNSQTQAGYLQSVAESGAIYVKGFLQPLIHEFDDAGNPSPAATEKLDRLLSGTRLGDRIEKINIFRRDGVVVYSTDKTLVGENFLSRAMVQAFEGEAIFRVLKDIDADQGPDLELYEPLYRNGSEQVFIVAELFINSTFFEAELARLQLLNWTVVAGMTVVVLALLFLAVLRSNRIIEGQQSALNMKLTEAEALSRTNWALREEADNLRTQASKSNEDLLHRIGADLHDGPVQLLSLLTLKLGAKSAGESGAANGVKSELDPRSIASRALAELREISSGLVLPEIANVPLEDAIRLAVRQHENLTGTKVVCCIGEGLSDPMPHALKICLYRVVQEALNNAYRHAGGRGQGVIVQRESNSIVLAVGDDGEGLLSAEHANQSGGGLGLYGINNRVRAFGGTMQIGARKGGGTEIVVTIPFDRPQT